MEIQIVHLVQDSANIGKREDI